MQTKRILDQTQNYSENEFLLLRSLALGMGDTCICKLLDVTSDELGNVQRTLYKKLEVKNCYAAVTKAFRLAYHDELSKVTPPEFFRITNFGKYKTGWLTVNPIKVTVDFTGELSRLPIPQSVTNPNPSMLH